ncbi:dihydrolipoamide acetyltransferase family protein [Photobacterium aphoticum]|uniref:Dihydrolipoamide acetyltransferase component of pyruvate dehydrogenase complex n=1 Tax=Photobacterium aphoticum TaxID=754436 RepID=A0A0J1GQ87_9GAMM|nr:dihydrolipoamide acetyltransferase family protein [Photobacterium aphoticum]KLV01938.1 branched-chain alpha-keto acid dehydrogenase subunit E2 [Photobacterium aphoticum]PSU60178.1 2-oxo acid dehydrogenase subunit E2 [Photobacterium aphoticum]GHA33800.1 dihydrolipoamide acetyltransferase component of pyruvate dehydrogenase complex [Photobacterium aphoticum]
MKTFVLPDLGEGLAESEIIQWHVNIGDMVETDQVILTVETAKATVEIPAPYSGTVVNRYGQAGDIISIGQPLIDISADAVTTEKTLSSPSGSQVQAQTESSTAKKSADAATVVGNVSQETQQVNVDEFWIGQHGSHTSDDPHTSSRPLSALPSARQLAQKLGVNLSLIEGSGPEGVIVDKDVYAACDEQLPGTEVLKGARRTMVDTMRTAHQQIAAVTLTEEASLYHWSDEEDITCRLVKAIVFACQQEPALNAWFDADTMTRCVHTDVNIGIAVDSKHGLYVPVLRHADSYNNQGIRKWLNRTVEEIRNRKIGREQFQHATITLSNFGAIAGLYATPVVTPPQVAIVGVGRINEKLTLIDNTPTLINTLPLSMTFDHRACTGGEAARFMKALVQHLEQE